MGGYRLFGKEARRGGGGIACHVIEVGMCLDWMNVEAVKNIQVRISGQTNVGDVMVCLPQTM